jgi:hypothetical protein
MKFLPKQRKQVERIESNNSRYCYRRIMMIFVMKKRKRREEDEVIMLLEM